MVKRLLIISSLLILGGCTGSPLETNSGRFHFSQITNGPRDGYNYFIMTDTETKEQYFVRHEFCVPLGTKSR